MGRGISVALAPVLSVQHISDTQCVNQAITITAPQLTVKGEEPTAQKDRMISVMD